LRVKKKNVLENSETINVGAHEHQKLPDKRFLVLNLVCLDDPNIVPGPCEVWDGSDSPFLLESRPPYIMAFCFRMVIWKSLLPGLAFRMNH
jgi:hypothetical protein